MYAIRSYYDRQADGDGGSFPNGALDRNLAEVLFDDLFGDGETEAGASSLGRKKRLENLLQVFLGDAIAVVAEGDAEGVVVLEMGADIV